MIQPQSNRKLNVYKLSKLWGIHREIIRLYVLGMRKQSIAAELGCSIELVNRTIESPIGAAEVERLQDARDSNVADIGRRIRELAPKALKVVEQIADGEIPSSGSARLNAVS